VAERREDLRAADSDRQFVAQRLQEALNEGRLDLSEYDERLQRTYTAKTYGELDKILDDLPSTVPPRQAQVSTTPPASPAAQPTAAKRKGLPPWLLMTWGSWFTTTVICVVIWLATGAHYPWPVWVAGPWGAILLGRTLMALASGDPHSYIEAQQKGDQDRRDARQDYRAARREYRRQRRGY
jgi:hypothetical protein